MKKTVKSAKTATSKKTSPRKRAKNSDPKKFTRSKNKIVSPAESTTSPGAELRRAAEEIILKKEALSLKKPKAVSPEKTQKILHELRVHQIELEMQNEEMRRTQVQLDATRARYFDLYDLAPVGYCTISEKGLIIEVNLTAATLLSVTREKLVKQLLTRFILKEDQDIYYLHRKKLFDTGKPQSCDLRMVKNDGTVFWAHLTTTIAEDEGGAKVCCLVMSDITERKRREEELHKRETQLRSTLESAADGILAVDNKGKLLHANQRFADLWRIPQSLLKRGDDRTLLDFVTNQLTDPKTFLKKVQKLYDSDAEDIDNITFKDGRIFERYSLPMILDGSLIGRVWSFRDITERKKTEEVLRISQEQLNDTHRLAHIGLWNWIIKTDTVTWSKELYRIAGIDPATPAPSFAEHSRIYTPESFKHLKAAVEKAMKTRANYQLELELIRPDGTTRWVNAFGGNTYDSKGLITGLHGTLQDITDRKLIEGSLKESEEKYHGIFDESIAAIYVFDAQKNFVNSNQAGIDLLGYPRKQLLQMSIPDVDADPIVVLPAHQELLAGDRIINYEHKLRRNDGTIITVLNNSRPLTDIKGNVIGMLSTLIDITERKKTEEKYQNILENIQEGYFEVDLAGNYTFLNDSMCRIHGYTQKELISINNRQYTEKEFAKKIFQAFNRVYKTGKPIKEIDWEIIRKDGVKRYIEASVSLRKDSFDRPIGFSGIIRDITERNLIEKTLKESEDRFKMQYQGSPIPTFTWQKIGKDFVLMDFNDAALTATKGEAKKFINKTAYEMYFDDQHDILQDISRCFEEKIAIKKELHSKHFMPGRNIIATYAFVPNDLVMVHVEDITERKKAEAEIAVLSNALTVALDPIVILDLDGKIINANEAAKRLFETEEVGVSALNYVAPEDKERIAASIQELIMGSGNNIAEFTVITKTGRTLYIEATGNLIVDVNGKATGLVVVERDITGRKRAEDALLRSEEDFRSLFEQSLDGITIFDKSGIIMANQAFCVISGLPVEKVIGKNPLEFIHPDDREIAAQRMSKIQSGEQIPKDYIYRALRADCSIRSIDLRSRLIEWKGKSAFQTIVRDVTEQKQAEEKLINYLNQLRNINENIANVMIYQINSGKDGNLREFTYLSPTIEKLHGLKIEDGYRDSALIYGQVLEEDLLALWKAETHAFRNNTKIDQEVRVKTPSGKIRWRQFLATPRALPNGDLIWDGIEIDITEKKLAEEALNTANAEWQATFDSVRDAICLLDADQRVIRCNKAMKHMFGLTQDDLTGRFCWEIVHGTSEPLPVCPVTKVLKSHKLEEIEIQMKEKWFNVIAHPVFDEKKSLAGIVHIIRDITENKQAQEELFESKEKYRILFEDSPDPYLILADGVILDCNRAAEKMLHGLREQIIGLSPGAFSPEFQPDGKPSAKAFEQQISKALKTGSKTFEWTHRRLNGLDFPVEVSASTMVMDGRPVMLCSLRDITERKQTEEALSASELSYRRLFESAKDGILILDAATGRINDVNPFLTDLLGYSREYLIGKAVWELGSFNDVLPNRNRFLELQRQQYVRYEDLPLETFDGRLINVEFVSNIYYVGHTKLIQCIIRDITERKKVEEALRVSDERYRHITNCIPDLIWMMDLSSGRFTYVNSAVERILGWTVQEYLQCTVDDVVTPRQAALDREMIEDELAKTASPQYDRNTIRTWESEELRKDGSTFTAEVSAAFLWSEDGKPVSIIGASRDITERKLAQDNLKKSEERYRALFTGTPDGMIVHDADGFILDSNEAFARRLEKPLAWLLGHHISEFITPENARSLKNNALHTLSGQSQVFETTFISASGNSMPAEIHECRIPWNKHQAVLSISRDITERKLAEETLRKDYIRLQSMVSNAPVVLFAVDKDGIFTLSEGKALTIMGLKGGEVVGRSAYDVYRDHPEDQDHFRRALNGEAFKTLVNAGDHFFDAYHEPVWGTDGNFDGSSGILVDITERKKAEEDLRKYQESLEDLVRERTNELESSNTELESFSYSVSHDLRAPLRTIDGFSRALLEDCADKLNSQGKEYLTRITAAARRMGLLIEDLLKLSRITRMEMNIGTVNLTQIARSVINELQSTEPQRHVKVTITNNLEDKADSRLIRIAIENLLENAWKFTRKNTEAVIEFGSEKREGENVYFIRDNGAGFDMAYAGNLFAPFQRLHTEDEYPGTGIGLATVSRVIHRHGGNVWAEGQTDKGATFYFTLQE
ncbi:MAG: PAS domain S-box protein [Deltaproteobacteria bacterium]|nr:PAS domain S-box protein [Deltaproteobacteria bacterium]